jgi:hypothetical protein
VSGPDDLETRITRAAVNAERLVAERDRLAERVKALEAGTLYETTQELIKARDAALAQVAELRVAGIKARRAIDELTGDSPILPGVNDLWADAARHLDAALAATADAGKWLEQHEDAVRAEEREACAKMIEAFPAQSPTTVDNPFRRGTEQVLADTMNGCRYIFAAAIRARKKK